MDKINSIKKKATTIVKDGVEPLEEGLRNYQHPKLQVEQQALERIAMCVGCPQYKDEPVDFLRVLDSRIPQAENKMCGECGCALPMLIRQSLKACDVWKGKK